MPHFFFLPPILDSTEAGAFFVFDFLEYCPRGVKKLVPISYVCFSGVHFAAFGVMEYVVFVPQRHKVGVVFYLLVV